MNKIESAHFIAIFFVSNYIDLSQYFNAGDLCTLTSCRLGTRSRTSASLSFLAFIYDSD